MAETTITSKRLREMLDKQNSFTTALQLVNYRKTLNAAELKALDSYNENPQGSLQPDPPTTTTTTVSTTKKTLTEPADKLIITRQEYPKWWKGTRTAKISLAAAGSQAIVSAAANFNLYITAIVFTVSGDTDITLSFGVFGASGPMAFGGTDEPRGAVMAFGEAPAPCGTGGLAISSSGLTITVGGFVTYYLERIQTTTTKTETKKK